MLTGRAGNLVRARDTAIRLPNGLPAYGARRGDLRVYQLIRDYFECGVDLRPGMTVFDVGANIGLFTLEVLQRLEGDVRLFCFEPAPVPFSHLERNVGTLFPESAVSLSRAAVADRPGTTTFYYRPLATTLSSLYKDGLTDEHRLAAAVLRPDPPSAYAEVVPQWVRRLPLAISQPLVDRLLRLVQDRTVAVPCVVTTVSEVIRDASLDTIDLLKVDVEGAELDVLRGVDAEHWPRIRSVILEVHDIDDRVAEVTGLLRSFGFDDVRVAQEWVFEGTNVHMVSGWRSS